MLHLFARLLETQGDIKKLTKEEKNLAKDAKNYMDRMYSRDIRIQDVAGILHVHPNYLSTLFRREYDQSPREYLRKVRMNQAKLLLATTEYSISFLSVKHFSLRENVSGKSRALSENMEEVNDVKRIC